MNTEILDSYEDVVSSYSVTYHGAQGTQNYRKRKTQWKFLVYEKGQSGMVFMTKQEMRAKYGKKRTSQMLSAYKGGK